MQRGINGNTIHSLQINRVIHASEYRKYPDKFADFGIYPGPGIYKLFPSPAGNLRTGRGELITMDTRSNVSHYRITEDGIKTLSFSERSLWDQTEVREYLKSTGFKPGANRHSCRLLHHQTGNLFCKMPAHRKGQLPHRPEHRSSNLRQHSLDL